jgi:phosphotriesterase-related protein
MSTKGKIRTVRGDIPQDELGITMCHEHILVDFTCFFPEITEATRRARWEAPVTMDILGELRRDPFLCKDNMLQLDSDLAIRELMHYKWAGGKTIVDCTSIGLGRDVRGLRHISEVTGLNIIAGAGFYLQEAHPKYVRERSIDELSSQIIRDVRDGVDNTGIKCGVIGEVGTSWPITKDEEKVVRAAVRAHENTGAPLNIHPQPWEQKAGKVLDIVEDETDDLSRIVLSHIDEMSYDVEYALSLAKRGCFVEFDTFGQENYFENWNYGDPKDSTRVDVISKLIKKGYASQILLSHDTCLKYLLKSYGGYGYDHILNHIVPEFRKSGVSEDEIQMMLVQNPKKLLAF